jgi:hypothetical protein
MARHVFFAFTNPVPGREADFNHWQDNTHVPDGLTIPGFVSARRFRVADAQFMDDPQRTRYVTIYEIESDDIAKTVAATQQLQAQFVVTDAMDLNTIRAAIYTQLGDVRKPK